MYKLHLGDCIEVMRAMPDNSVDSIVTDPPYELGFMGKSWDSSGIANNVEMWREALRVLKPGGHLLAFSGTRTQHRMVCAIEDAGFEIRDSIPWLYGSGFPKSLNVSKAIDKAAGAEREVIGSKAGLPGYRMGETGDNDVYGAGLANGSAKCAITAPATDAARQWEGWGTALKPAHEPCCMARKSLIGTVAANVLAHGTGALNIDGCRVGDAGGCKTLGGDVRTESQDGAIGAYASSPTVEGLGRWPANIIHDGSAEVVALFPDSKGQQAATAARTQGGVYGVVNDGVIGVEPRGDTGGDTGSAARFFYCAKASKADRGTENIHPTVKPTDLMAYLCRLVTPPGGVVLDPFMGSGSTGKAAVREGFRFIGIDMTAEYLPIAQARIERELTKGLV
jgi:hypothetical protein